jgi:6-phosphogluconate dehydrogenase
MKNQIGVIGMAVMGKNIALNFHDNGYNVAVFNRTSAVTEEVVKENPQLNAYYDLAEFVQSLDKPRKILLMVKAGMPVDSFIEKLVELLDEGDIIMDGGNSNYHDSIKRYEALTEKGLNFLGVGISGGEEGARFGPAIMPGGAPEAYAQVSEMLEKVAAKAYGEACVSYIGSSGAGHYVKMVHNGIEYGDMQLIAEAYHLLKELGGFNNQELSDIFKTYNEGELNSYLIEITVDILKEKDDLTEGYLVNYILDKAGNKGTGKWSVSESLDEGVNTSIITGALYNRFLSFEKDERVRASKVLEGPAIKQVDDKQKLIKQIGQALYMAKIMSYAQGFDLMAKSAKTHGWELDFEKIAKGWRGGCIIRAHFLDEIAQVYADNPNLENLMLSDYFKDIIHRYQESAREIVVLAIQNGISVIGLSSALSYYDAYRNAFNPANLIQAQRDYFGAHTYERTDREGVYHHEWFE